MEHSAEPTPPAEQRNEVPAQGRTYVFVKNPYLHNVGIYPLKIVLKDANFGKYHEFFVKII